MSTQVTTLAAEQRARAGKGAAHAVRRNGMVPAVIYGDGKSPLLISMESKVVERYAGHSGFFTHLLDLEIEGKKHRVLPRDVQFDPVSDRPIHADFMRVSPTTKVRVSVPVSFVNSDKSPGIKRGGTLNVVHHRIDISCSPSQIPEKFEVNLEGLQIGDAIHLSDIKLPEGVKAITNEKDFTVASIAVPSGIRAELEAAAAAAAAPEAAAAAPAAGAAAAPAAAGKAAAAPAAAAAKPAAGGKK